MKKISDRPEADRQRVSITERSLLIAHGQSKKLADIRKRLQPDLPVEAMQHNSVPKKRLLTGLKPEVAEELNKAISLIDDSINRIMRSFPEGKKNRLFGFRFGSVDAVKAMSIKAAFKTLGIDDNAVKMKLIAELNYHGDEVKGR
jgi:CO dehydrogenase/acetyl-CoA synthase alpha subunit